MNDDPALDVRVVTESGKWFVLYDDDVQVFNFFDSADLYACLLIEALRDNYSLRRR